MLRKNNISRNMMNTIIKELINAPDSQVGIVVKDKCKQFLNEVSTDQETYDFIVSISKLKIEQVSEHAYIGDITPFVVALCDLTKFYERPEA